MSWGKRCDPVLQLPGAVLLQSKGLEGKMLYGRSRLLVCRVSVPKGVMEHGPLPLCTAEKVPGQAAGGEQGGGPGSMVSPALPWRGAAGHIPLP